MRTYTIPKLPLNVDLETVTILKQLNNANKQLAELKGVAQTIPNEAILINSLTLQEAKDSSEVENIVTTHDELYKAELDSNSLKMSAPTKEVLRYREALHKGFDSVRSNKLLTNQIIKLIQKELEGNTAGFRAVPGTSLKNNKGDVIYTPPQDINDIEACMNNLESFINDDSVSDLDPLIKMAVIHHQFESIHPFYDGNGRTGRIISILYLVVNDLLDLPILYLSRYITQNKTEYYRLLQAIRDAMNTIDSEHAWQEWILFNLKGVEETAKNTIVLVKGINKLMFEYKQVLKPLFGKQYKHELINNIFFHPYTKIEFMEREMQVQRKSAAKYLDKIVDVGLLSKIKLGRTNYYVNNKLVDLFVNTNSIQESSRLVDTIETINNIIIN